MINTNLLSNTSSCVALSRVGTKLGFGVLSSTEGVQSNDICGIKLPLVWLVFGGGILVPGVPHGCPRQQKQGVGLVFICHWSGVPYTAPVGCVHRSHPVGFWGEVV